ncbi:MAG: hypothetical protein ACYS9X_00880, partial [Planctomycetota bacterium]|jgi:hypothetical protein
MEQLQPGYVVFLEAVRGSLDEMSPDELTGIISTKVVDKFAGLTGPLWPWPDVSSQAGGSPQPSADGHGIQQG